MTEAAPTMHCDTPPEPDPVQVEALCCAYCRMLFSPTKRWQAFCSSRCRNSYNADFGTHGQVASVRRINRGASIVIHLEGPAAERALKLGIKDPVLLVKRP